MSPSLSALAVIPVRRGSKRVPRKNLRILRGQPLIVHAIRACRGVTGLDVVVSTDDPEIASLCQRLQVATIDRSEHLAGDDVPLDPVVLDSWERCGGGDRYWALVTVQATSPLVSAADVQQVLDELGSTRADTALTVVEDRHIRWRLDDVGEPYLETSRVNRQQLPQVFRETGAVVACTAAMADSGRRFGDRIRLVPMPPTRGLDIDTPADFLVAEALLSQHHVVFNVIGSALTGTGHVHRAMALARSMPGHESTFVCGVDDELAWRLLERNYFPYSLVDEQEDRTSAIAQLNPTVVVNDVLDTDSAFVQGLRAAVPAARVVHFEDLGDGATHADAVVNALYPTRIDGPNVRGGPDWAVLRPEFMTGERVPWRDQVRRILLTFGGTDESGLTVRVLREVAPLAAARGCEIDVVLGLGFSQEAELNSLLRDLGSPASITIAANVDDMAGRMRASDLAVTSAGRTVLECASQGLPAVVVAQNARELTHSFADVDHGILNLGAGKDLRGGAVEAAVRTLLDVAHLRAELHRRLQQVEFVDPTARLVGLILGTSEPRKG